MVTVSEGGLSIVVGDGAQSWPLAEVHLHPQPGSRLAITIAGARLYFRPDLPAECGRLVALARRNGSPRLPSLGLEGTAVTEPPLPPGDATRLGHPIRSHTCQWEVRSRAYGIVRKICVICRAVSIDLTDAERRRIRHVEPGG
jgi:hypothetical protein